MVIECPSCHGKFRTKELDAGRNYRVNCPKCANTFTVQPSPSEAQQASAVAEPPPSATHSPPTPTAPSPPTETSPAAVETTVAGGSRQGEVQPEQWQVGRNGEQLGNFTTETLVAAVAEGKMPRDVLVWRGGMAAWTLLSDVPTLVAAVDEATVREDKLSWQASMEAEFASGPASTEHNHAVDEALPAPGNRSAQPEPAASTVRELSLASATAWLHRYYVPVGVVAVGVIAVGMFVVMMSRQLPTEKAGAANSPATNAAANSSLARTADKENEAQRHRKACDAGVMKECTALAIMYGVGDGVAKDGSSFAKLLVKACSAADSPDGNACYRIGVYLASESTSREQGIKYLKTGCKLGESQACELANSLNHTDFSEFIESHPDGVIPESALSRGGWLRRLAAYVAKGPGRDACPDYDVRGNDEFERRESQLVADRQCNEKIATARSFLSQCPVVASTPVEISDYDFADKAFRAFLKDAKATEEGRIRYDGVLLKWPGFAARGQYTGVDLCKVSGGVMEAMDMYGKAVSRFGFSDLEQAKEFKADAAGKPIEFAFLLDGRSAGGSLFCGLELDKPHPTGNVLAWRIPGATGWQDKAAEWTAPTDCTSARAFFGVSPSDFTVLTVVPRPVVGDGPLLDGVAQRLARPGTVPGTGIAHCIDHGTRVEPGPLVEAVKVEFTVGVRGSITAATVATGSPAVRDCIKKLCLDSVAFPEHGSPRKYVQTYDIKRD